MVKLAEIRKELLTQDNASTSYPLFAVFDWEKMPTTSDYTDEWEYADLYDGYLRIGKTKEDLMKWAEEREYEPPEGLDADELFDWLEKKYPYGLIKNYYIRKRVFHNIFFTEKGAKNFIAANSYHYDEPHIYVICAWRNEEMQDLMKYLEETDLTDIKLKERSINA